ncbi:MAG TPA: tubulin-like doman-containing protein [Anaerolineaceae bacterium]
MVESAQEKQIRVGMRPTLLIGLGGSGQMVLAHLKARFIHNYGEVPPAIEFLGFDTDQTATAVQVGGQVVSLTKGVELVEIGGIETANIIRNLDRYPSIAEWIAEDKERIPTAAIVMGAKQVRPLGRLSMFWNVEKIFNKIDASIRRLTDIKLSSDQIGVNVFIVSSVCGGTGSGAILDIAYLARHVISKLGARASFCYVNAILTLPSVFPTVDKNGIESNAFACMRELDYFIEQGRWTIDYGNPRVRVVEFDGVRPFNICYLVDARNEQGLGLAGMPEIAPMLAEAMYLQISSQVGRAQDSAFDNVRALTDRSPDPEDGKLKYNSFSGLGTASLVYPVHKIIDQCAYKLGQELLTNHLLKDTVQVDRVDAAVGSFVQANQLEIDTLLQVVARDSKGNLVRIALDPRVLDRFKENELLNATQAYLTKAESTVDNEFTQLLEFNRKAAVDRLTQALTTEVERVVDDPNGGLKFADLFLERLDMRLSKMRTDMDKQRMEMDQRRDKAQAQLRQTQNEFVQSYGGFPIGRGGRVREARNRHVEMFQIYLAAKFESRKREAAIALQAALSTVIQAKRAGVKRTVDRLQFIQGMFQANVEKMGTGPRARVDFVLSEDVTSDADIETWYKEHYALLGASPAIGLLEAKGPLHSWFDIEQDALSDRVMDYARGVFDDLKQKSIEDIIVSKRSVLDPRKRLDDLIKRSVPFWMFREEGVLGQGFMSEEITVIGVPDAERSIYKGMTEERWNLSSTFDPYQITILRTKHGVPAFALTQWRDFKQAHDHILRNNLKPLYVFPDVRPGGEHAKQVFALGVAYGYIFKSGVFYYLVSADPAEPPIRIDQGMDKSLGIFRNNEDYIRLIEGKYQEKISNIGVDAASKVLEEFIANPYVYELKGGAKVTNLDTAAMTKDLTIWRVGSQNYDLVKQLREIVKNYMKVLRA